MIDKKYFKGLSLKTFLYALGIISVSMTLIRHIPLDYWWIRMFDFPQIQITILSLLAMALFLANFKIDEKKEVIFLLVLFGCFLHQIYFISPFTTLSSYNVLESTTDKKDNTIKLYTANVLQKNKSYDLVSRQIDSISPDVVLLTETDNSWKDAITTSLSKDYRYKKEIPLPNTYGMILYSKLELIEPEIKFLVDDSIPSISTKLKLRNGEIIQMYAIHPTPPMPQENPKSTDRDAEMMITAKMARESDLPVIVLGDFNDVAWSDTTSLFKKTGMLLDPRIGRGLFSSFDANNPVLRWPLDHLFISEEFRVKDINLCDDIDSDHFPFYSELTFEPEGAAEQMPEKPTKEQSKDANDQMRNHDKREYEFN